MIRPAILAAVALFLSFTMTGCDGGARTDAPADRSATGFVRPAGFGTLFYGEVYKAENNRFYVFGTKAGMEAYKASGEIPLSKAFINRGPKGETVQVEAEKEGNQMANRLIADFDTRWGLSAK